ncbi:MAG: AGE family epimerase/isomerase [Candidatus Kapabacteria bacterium]|nr:AGE family epimerase/isomerase [Ignavibacteriota bacterium]MCW5885284.1 AGE family epimerase/isomerase [Candidatus Kapabacteria bacterium]
MQNMNFTFSDLISGYVKSFDFSSGIFVLETSDKREYNVALTDTTFAELVRNLGEPFINATDNMRDMLEPGRFLFAYGTFFPEDNAPFEAKHIVFVGRSEKEYRFETPEWWIKQVEQLGNFYINAQFGSDEIDFTNYRTELTLEGTKTGSSRQETDTISRLVYGFASAYMLTGNDKFLEAAEKGTIYLREHFRAVDSTEDIVFWYHAIDRVGNKVKKILASEFGDDYDAIPAYEQIYALAGPIQTYRITGDKRIYDDARKTVNLFNKFFIDKEKGGYFSHIDPVTFDPRAESLTRDKSRKNWNSVGDHTPAYLINLFLATGEEDFKKMLEYTADMITEHFGDYDNSPFVQEKFHEDWSKDQSWGWQQNRAVVGHNLKIAWNLTRVYNLIKKDSYSEFAHRIAQLMPEHGMDKQRGGWYDVVDRTLSGNHSFHRFAWHDRKAWWQQEQGILAYLIMHGTYGNNDYLKYARESSSFYNAWFLDHDSGAIYFNVLANGLPYLLGTEREKGSHSMSGYHSFELCYLAAVYTNLLITKQPMTFYFKPNPKDLSNGVLRVAPDLLPFGSVKLTKVLVNDEVYNDFNAEELSVNLSGFSEQVRVKVEISPTSGLEHFDCSLSFEGDNALLTLSGELDKNAVNQLRSYLSQLGQNHQLTIDMNNLTYLSPEGARALIFVRQKIDISEKILLKGASGQPKDALEKDEFTEEVSFV